MTRYDINLYAHEELPALIYCQTCEERGWVFYLEPKSASCACNTSVCFCCEHDQEKADEACLKKARLIHDCGHPLQIVRTWTNMLADNDSACDDLCTLSTEGECTCSCLSVNHGRDHGPWGGVESSHWKRA